MTSEAHGLAWASDEGIDFTLVDGALENLPGKKAHLLVTVLFGYLVEKLPVRRKDADV
jgi:hypothetical protein